MVNSTLTSYDLLLLEFCPLLYCHDQKDTAPPFGTLQLITSIFCCKARQISFFFKSLKFNYCYFGGCYQHLSITSFSPHNI